MPSACIIGMQWGDEGKAAHRRPVRPGSRHRRPAPAAALTQVTTVVVGKDVFKLHQLPSGILRGKECVIGNGVVLDPELLNEEIEELLARGVQIADNLHVSDRAHVVMPLSQSPGRAPRKSNRASWARRAGASAPCYSDKSARTGIRVCDLLDEKIFARRLESAVASKNRLFASFGSEETVSADEITARFEPLVARLRPLVTDTSVYLNDAISAGKQVLFEGAQGSLLDIDHGTYPFVTSSNSSVTGVSAGAGIPPKHVGKAVGVVKAYTTRVGEGPFPTELTDAMGEHPARERR